MRLNSDNSLQAEINRLYQLHQGPLQAIIHRYGRVPTPRDLPADRRQWGTRGVYFFFEPGEFRAGTRAQRIVRVGTHSSDNASIESRVVGEHLKEWGRSVFRRHVGTALILRGDFDNSIHWAEREQLAASWYARVNGWAVHADPRRLDRRLHELHPLVTEYIGSMSLIWVEIPDRTDRLEFERQCIRLLSNYSRSHAPVDPPSDDWLGRHALSSAIQISGLWNVHNVKSRHRPGFLDQFEKYYKHPS